MEEEESPDAEFIRDLQDFFLPYSTADADQEVVLDLTLQYFTLLRICYKITQQSSGVYDEFTDHVMNLLYYIEGYKSCMNDTLDYLENTLEMEETSEAVCNMKNHIINHIAELLHQHLGNCPQVVLLELCDPYLPEMFRLANNPQLLETTWTRV